MYLLPYKILDWLDDITANYIMPPPHTLSRFGRRITPVSNRGTTGMFGPRFDASNGRSTVSLFGADGRVKVAVRFSRVLGKYQGFISVYFGNVTVVL